MINDTPNEIHSEIKKLLNLIDAWNAATANTIKYNTPEVPNQSPFNTSLIILIKNKNIPFPKFKPGLDILKT